MRLFAGTGMIAVLISILTTGTGCGGSSGSSSQASSGKSAGTVSTTAPKAPAAIVTSAPGAASVAIGATRATLHAGTHHPVVGRPWPIHITVTTAGQPARSSVVYNYLYGGQVVAHRSHYTFLGRFSDTLEWPASAVGYPLTFRAVVVTGATTLNLDYAVQVSK